MTDNIDKKNPEQAEKGTVAPLTYGRPALAWISLALAMASWASMFWINGYVALGLAIASTACGFAGMPGRSVAVKRLAITAVIAAIVLIAVLLSFIMVIKIGLS